MKWKLCEKELSANSPACVSRSEPGSFRDFQVLGCAVTSHHTGDNASKHTWEGSFLEAKGWWKIISVRGHDFKTYHRQLQITLHVFFFYFTDNLHSISISQCAALGRIDVPSKILTGFLKGAEDEFIPSPTFQMCVPKLTLHYVCEHTNMLSVEYCGGLKKKGPQRD